MCFSVKPGVKSWPLVAMGNWTCFSYSVIYRLSLLDPRTERLELQFIVEVK